MKQYRLPFFIGLERELSKFNVELHVVYGTPWAEEAKRGDNAELAGPLGHRVPTFRLFRKLYFQPSLSHWLRSDLVVLEPANKHAVNYLLMLLYFMRLKRIAYWGHGYDRQSSQATLGNRFKRKSMLWADWWFAYTLGSAKYVVDQGFESHRVTVVENAIDTLTLRLQLADVSQFDIEHSRNTLGWDSSARICVFCGSLYPNKKIDLLFEAAQLVHHRYPSFRLLILGGGPLEGDVRNFSHNREWVRYLGPVFGREKAVLLKMSELWLNPGLIGLGILDGFCAGLPVITTSVTFHSPEIEYLESGINGLMVSPDADSYADAVLNLLQDKITQHQLTEGARITAERYNMKNMIANFADGIRKCLNIS